MKSKWKDPLLKEAHRELDVCWYGLLDAGLDRSQALERIVNALAEKDANHLTRRDWGKS